MNKKYSEITIEGYEPKPHTLKSDKIGQLYGLPVSEWGTLESLIPKAREFAVLEGYGYFSIQMMGNTYYFVHGEKLCLT